MANISRMPSRPISSTTRFGGLIGREISHSLSPFIHNTAASLLGLDLIYLNFDLPFAPSREFLQNLLGSNCYGFNVTVPYKEAVVQNLGNTSLSSCNTLIPGGNRWDMASTDAEGFLEGLKNIDRDLSDFSAVICLGHGGAAKALIECFLHKAPSLPIFVLKRGTRRQGQEGERLRERSFEPSALSELISEYPISLVIQCTSAPLKGDDLSRFCPALRDFKGTFVDLVYGKTSALLKEAKNLGILSQDGLSMLIAQALLSEKLWWGQSVEFSAMKAALAAHGPFFQ
jgi:shikimate dehydrogenase